MKDEQIIDTAKKFTKGLLGTKGSKDMCFIVASSLQPYLKICGLNTEIKNGFILIGVVVNDHYWLELPDGRILDATADQFNDRLHEDKHLPTVYLGEKPSWFQLYKKTKKPRQKI